MLYLIVMKWLFVMKMILILLFLSDLLWHIKFEKRKPLKKELNEELMPVGLGRARG